jgi:hypothetical protein
LTRTEYGLFYYQRWNALTDSSFTPFTDPNIVAAYMQPLLEHLAVAFSVACQSAIRTFADRSWSRDAALSAYLVRKEVVESLRAEGVKVEEEDLELESKALCGLSLKLQRVHLKIRKSKDGEIPPAGSEQSMSFYNWNLLVFPQGDGEEDLPLHLMLLWNDDKSGELDTLLLACVEGNNWRWRIPVFQRNPSQRFVDSAQVRLQEVTIEPTYSSGFDTGNEDVPLKLIENPPTQGSEQKVEPKTEVRDQKIEEKKKSAK